MLNVRLEKPKDYRLVKKINDLAFGQVAEGEIVDRLRESGINYLSLVAKKTAILSGIFFSAQSKSKDILNSKEVWD